MPEATHSAYADITGGQNMTLVALNPRAFTIEAQRGEAATRK